jgi:hypothetical protein
MQGEFRGDFTRDTFDLTKHFSRVLVQQGRVQVDADWNEQTSILLHYLRSLATDLRGPHWGPEWIDGEDNQGFGIGPGQEKDDFPIMPGRYYVDGILCECHKQTVYLQQDEFRVEDRDRLETGIGLVYLDVWERHITFLEDDRIRETALGGPDTATRAKVVWQVKVVPPEDFKTDWPTISGQNTDAQKRDKIDAFLKKYVSSTPQFMKTGVMRAMAKEAGDGAEPCAISPQSRYRGLENHLYRVEIHRSGNAWNKEVDEKSAPAGNIETAASFKWSRDNGSVVFPIMSLRDGTAVLASLGRDDTTTLRLGNWVEIVDDDLALRGRPGPLRQVASIDSLETSVTLSTGAEPLPAYSEDSSRHPLLRRWDFRNDRTPGNGLTLSEGAGDERDADWIELEDGVQVQFPAPAVAGQSNIYRTGDYWLIPARTATGDVEWPQETKGGRESPQAIPPHGIDHYYAPLAVIQRDDAGKVTVILDCRRRF